MEICKKRVPTSSQIREILSTRDDREWESLYYEREKYIQKYAFSLYSYDELQILKELFGDRKVVEVGCGTGYLTSCMKSLCNNYSGIDNYSTKYYHKEGGKTLNRDNTQVIQMSASQYMNTYGKGAKFILMSWPDMSDMAFKVIKQMRVGSTLVYKGEDFGGCTASDKFFMYTRDDSMWELNLDTTRDLNSKSNQFYGIHDYWSVYTKIRGRK